MGWWSCVSLRRALAGVSEGYRRVITAWLESGLFPRKVGGLLTSIFARSLAASLADMGAGTAPAAQSSGLGISVHDLGIAFATISPLSAIPPSDVHSRRLLGTCSKSPFSLINLRRFCQVSWNSSHCSLSRSSYLSASSLRESLRHTVHQVQTASLFSSLTFKISSKTCLCRLEATSCNLSRLALRFLNK
jgi:hypothetical protein